MCLMDEPVWNFEQEPHDPSDETGVNLRAYLDRMPDEKLRQYSAAWTDERVVDWDGNFRDDGALMLICSERDVEVAEYRKVLEECIRYRDRLRKTAKSVEFC
jgi:hypothetical protein